MKPAIKKSPEMLKQLRQFGQAIILHSTIIFVVMFMGALIYALISLNVLLNKPSDEGYRTQQQQSTSPTKFDQQTIDRINKLNSATSPNVSAMPSGRYNPFSE